MAGEKKGIAFESLVFIALRDLGYILSVNMFWGQKPKGFSIDPDFVLGQLEHPTHWLLVTNTESAKNTPEKFWRNVAELCEVKRTFEPIPRVLNIVFEAKQMARLQDAMAMLADADILVEHQDYGQTLLRCVEDCWRKLPSNRELIVTALSQIISNDTSIMQAFLDFRAQLELALRKNNHKLDLLWELLRTEPRREYRSAKKTYVRRGIAKLMVVPQDLRQAFYNNVLHRTRLPDLPKFLSVMSFVGPSITGGTIADPEIRAIIRYFDPEEIEYVIDRSYSIRKIHWDKWLAELRNPRVEEYQDYIVKNYEELITTRGMLERLQTHAKDGPKWLFWHLIELYKVNSGKRQGYGFAVLARDVGYTRGISQGYKYLADWANDALKQILPEQLLPDVAAALSMRLAQISKDRLIKLGSVMERAFLTNLLEQKFVAYLLFEPLPLLLQKRLKAMDMSYSGPKKHPTFIGELISDPSHITTPVILANGTLIHWKSAYDKGRHHKTKELSGRAPALRFEYDSSSATFKRRTGVEKLVLIVDGTFTDAQLVSLFEAGWDEIYYADEISQFLSRL